MLHVKARCQVLVKGNREGVMRLIGILMSKCYNIIIAGCLKCLKLVYCFANLISLVEIVLLIGQLLMYTVCSMQSRGHTPYDLPLISS